MYYDKKGKRISMETWGALLEDPNYKLVKVTEIADVKVSTVWLGLDHGFGGKRPVIFETMTFPGNDCERYCTLREAIAGHEQMVEQVKREMVEGVGTLEATESYRGEKGKQRQEREAKRIQRKGAFWRN